MSRARRSELYFNPLGLNGAWKLLYCSKLTRLHCPPLIQSESKVTLAILTRKMKTYRKVVFTKVTLYYINSSNSTNCFIAFGMISTIILKKVSQKLFIIIVKIASVLHLVICLVLVGPSSPSKLKLYGAIS